MLNIDRECTCRDGEEQGNQTCWVPTIMKEDKGRLFCNLNGKFRERNTWISKIIGDKSYSLGHSRRRKKGLEAKNSNTSKTFRCWSYPQTNPQEKKKNRTQLLQKENEKEWAFFPRNIWVIMWRLAASSDSCSRVIQGQVTLFFKQKWTV